MVDAESADLLWIRHNSTKCRILPQLPHLKNCFRRIDFLVSTFWSLRISYLLIESRLHPAVFCPPYKRGSLDLNKLKSFFHLHNIFLWKFLPLFVVISAGGHVVRFKSVIYFFLSFYFISSFKSSFRYSFNNDKQKYKKNNNSWAMSND